MEVMDLRMMKRAIISFILTVVIFSGIVWYSHKAYTGEVATVIAVNERSILVRNYEGR